MAATKEEILATVREIVEPWRGRKGALIPLLQETQRVFGYLPSEAMEALSEETCLPLAEIYGVATFYAQFHLEPRGRHVIRVCRGTACHVRGSLKLLERLRETLGVAEGGTTEDGRFTLEPVACLGACGLAPVMTIGDQTFGRVAPEKLPEILAAFL